MMQEDDEGVLMIKGLGSFNVHAQNTICFLVACLNLTITRNNKMYVRERRSISLQNNIV